MLSKTRLLSWMVFFLVLTSFTVMAQDSDYDGIIDDNDAYPFDFDNDGMPDLWEKKYGLRADLNDASNDYDKDGLSNIQEYYAGRNPIIPESGEIQETCYDKTQNQGESGIDCGGPCKSCSEQLSPGFEMSMNTILIGGGVLVIILVIFVVLMLGKKKSKPVQLNAQQIMAKNYVTNMLMRGYTKEQVRAAMISQGWPPEMVEEIFKSLYLET